MIKLFRNRNYQILDLQDFKLHLSELHTFDVDSLEVSILLLQTGYLTVKELDVFRQILTLGFPNKEVEVSFSLNLLKELTQHKPNPTTGILVQLESVFNSGDVYEAISLLKSLFANIPYSINSTASDTLSEKERFYHSIFFTVLKLLGLHIEPEVLTYKGRIDAVIQTDEFVYIIEFKIGDADAALAQIREKEYHLGYTHLGKKIILLGIGFDVEEKNIGG